MAIEARTPRVDPDGLLELMGDPGPWIQNNPHSRLLVKSLMLNFRDKDDVEEIADSIGELTELIRLEISWGKSLKCLPNTITRLQNLEHLKIYHCGLEELPPNLSLLVSLTHLELSCCNIKTLPMSDANLSKLTSLSLEFCHSLTELPYNLEHLKSLTHLQLSHCNIIKTLPTSAANLSKLTFLSFYSCRSLIELPCNLGHFKSLTHLQLSHCWGIKSLPNSMNLLNLKLHSCGIQFLPTGLINVKYLDLSACIFFSNQSLANLKDSQNLHHLYISCCTNSICCRDVVVELPENLNYFAQLCLVDIIKSNIKCLPWSITALPKLRHLMLPKDFRLHTLPSELNDSIIISVSRRHVRETWEELKKQIWPSSNPVARMESTMDSAQHPSIIFPPGYLKLKGDPWQWIHDNNDSLMLVRILELKDLDQRKNSKDYSVENMTQLNELTHLYISGCKCLTDTYFVKYTRLKHLSLEYCDKKSLSHILSNDSLSKLSNLETLHLSLQYGQSPPNINLPLSLQCLSLERGNMELLHDSLEKLTNLKTIDLYDCCNLNWLPENLYFAKVRLINCNLELFSLFSFKSLPTGLRHLEILSPRDNPENWLDKLVNLETLSFTCRNTKLIPGIAGLRNLQKLQLKDCFSLKELPPDLDKLVNLCSLDITGTRIKSLPDSIMNLHKLQRIILPKCFRWKSLAMKLQKVSRIDFTEVAYYKRMSYSYFEEACLDGVDETFETGKGVIPRESCNEDVNIVPIAGVDETVTVEQTSAHVGYSEQIPSEQGVISQVDRDSKLNGRETLINENSRYVDCSSQNPFSSSGNELLPSRNTRSVNAAKIHDDELYFKDMSYDNDDDSMEIKDEDNGIERDSVVVNNEAFSEEGIINAQASPRGLLVTPVLGDFCSNRRENSNPKGESSHAIQNDQNDIMISETEQGNATCDTREIDFGEKNHHASENGQNQILQNDNVTGKTRKGISLEMLQQWLHCCSNNMTQVEARKKYDVTSTTMKRKLKESEDEWRRKRKVVLDAKERIQKNTEAPFESGSSQQNLVNPSNPVDHLEISGERTMGVDQLKLPNHVSFKSNAVNNLTPDATMETVRETLIATQFDTYRHQHVEEHLNVANEVALPNSLQRNESSSTFVVKATYKDYIVRFQFSLSYSIDQLKEEVANQLELEANTFIIKYQDEDKDWVLMTRISNLEHALHLSRSSNSSSVRLLIVPKT